MRARAMLATLGVDDERGRRAVRSACRDDGFLRCRPDQIAWQARVAARRRPSAKRCVRARARRASTPARWKCSCTRPTATACSPRSSPRSTASGLGDPAGARARRPDGTRFDSFEVLPADAALPDAAARRRAAPARRRCAARSTASRPRAAHAAAPPAPFPHRRRRSASTTPTDGAPHALSLVCTDRPGLLADVAQVLREQRPARARRAHRHLRRARRGRLPAHRRSDDQRARRHATAGAARRAARLPRRRPSMTAKKPPARSHARRPRRRGRASKS